MSKLFQRFPGASCAALLVAALLSRPAHAEDASPDAKASQQERFSLHYQATVNTQVHPSFAAKYTGQNSMRPEAESATSVVMDLFAGARLWTGGEFFIQPEVSGGRGLSQTLGVAAFPSGEVYRVGNPEAVLLVARLFFRQVINLGGPLMDVESGPNVLGGRRARDTLTLSVGKMALPDLVDNNPASNDPHTRFSSWALFASGAYDYPADTRGYTPGVTADLTVDWWSVRTGLFLEPKYANLATMEYDLTRSRGLTLEFEGRYSLAGRRGAARALAFHNTARMGSYGRALDAAAATPGAAPDVTATRAFGRTKAGFALSMNQELADGVNLFSRIAYNDGANETWAFTEIDHSFSAGLTQNGARWGREADETGVGLAIGGISPIHRRYLASGGYGFLIGDGALKYGLEVLGEAYYRASLTKEISLAVAYQPVINPGYNQDRGPIHVFTGRAHFAF